MTTHDLPDAELEVLASLDRLGPTTARRLREAMDDFRPMAQGSMLTLLQRLESKDYVTRGPEKEGKAHLYRVRRDPRPTFRRVTRRLTSRIFGGDSAALMASLFETEPPSAEEIERLRSLVDAYAPDDDDQNGEASR